MGLTVWRSDNSRYLVVIVDCYVERIFSAVFGVRVEVTYNRPTLLGPRSTIEIDVPVSIALGTLRVEMRCRWIFNNNENFTTIFIPVYLLFQAD
jgi:hypothetical protein